jgi:hypothetical protein
LKLSKCSKLSRNGGNCKHLKNLENVGSPNRTICEPLDFSFQSHSEGKNPFSGE